jgi:outer membrane protein
MKKIAGILALTALFTLSAHADFARIEAGLGMWQSDPSGSVTSGGDTDNVDTVTVLDYDTENINYAWLLFKHPLPLIPNIRLEYTDLSHTGNLNSSVIWHGNDYNTSASSDLDLEQIDLALYYNLLDNTFWSTLDLGLNVKYIDASFSLKDGTKAYSDSDTILVPMAFVRARIEVPATDLGMEGDIKYIAYSDSSYFDARIKADYTFDITPVIQPAIEVGYRMQKLEIDEDGFDVMTDIDFSGFYVGVMARF